MLTLQNETNSEVKDVVNGRNGSSKSSNSDSNDSIRKVFEERVKAKNLDYGGKIKSKQSGNLYVLEFE